MELFRRTYLEMKIGKDVVNDEPKQFFSFNTRIFSFKQNKTTNEAYKNSLHTTKNKSKKPNNNFPLSLQKQN